MSDKMLLMNLRELGCSVTDFHCDLVQVARERMVWGFVNLFKLLNTFVLCYEHLEISLVTCIQEFNINREAIS